MRRALLALALLLFVAPARAQNPGDVANDLPAAVVEEQITVTADAPLLNTESGTTTSTITER